MWFKIIAFAFVVAIVFGTEPAPSGPSKFEINPDGSYEWSYESDLGHSQQQSGQQLLGPEGGQAAQGVAQWYDPEGKLHQLQYTADDNGFQPTSEDLPVGPPVPKAILRALEWNAAHPQENDA